MKKIFGNLYMCSIIAIAMVAFLLPAHAAVVSRPTAANNAAAARAKSGVRTPSTTIVSQSTPKTQTVESVSEPEPTPEPETPIIVDNKTSMFQDVMSEIGASAADESNNELADAIRRQRALLDGAANAASNGGDVNMGTAAACDSALRTCMAEKCGNDFSKCANDSTTIWGQKIDGCRAKTKCTAHEYSLIAPEILADRDMNVRMSHYNSVINCGNRYNDCIFTQCGKTLNKCLSKKDGDNAVSKCASIANECKAMDNGLASRVMTVFGDLRKIATAQVKKDEARLSELRKLMRDQCSRFGAMFDERTLDCVYTVNFFAGEDNTLMASKKLYSGDSFQCTPNWFGIDITTYMENAQRLTRSQKSASSAALGAGLGTAAGMLSSGAIGRALKSQKAEKAVNEAACKKAGGEWTGRKCVDEDGEEIEFDENGTTINKPRNGSNGGGSNPSKDKETECKNKESDGYEWDSENKECKLKCADGQEWTNNECTAAQSPAEETIEEEQEHQRPHETVVVGEKCGENGSGVWTIDETANKKCTKDTEAHKCKCVVSSSGGSGNAPDESKPVATPKADTNGRVIGANCNEEDIKKLKPYGWLSGTYIRVKDNSTTLLKARCETKKDAGDSVPCNCKAAECDASKNYELGSNGLCVKKKAEQKPAEEPKETSTGKPAEERQEKPKESPKQTTTGQLDPSVDGIGFCAYQIDGQSDDNNANCSVSKPGDWGVKFPNYVVYGKAVCNKGLTTANPVRAFPAIVGRITGGNGYLKTKINQTNHNGSYCWCKMTNPNGSYWVNGWHYSTDKERCASNCASDCAFLLSIQKDFRNILFIR